MAHKYQTFADLLYASYSGLQTLGFAFAKGKRRYDRECYAFRESVIKRLKAGEMKIGDLYQNIIRQNLLGDLRKIDDCSRCLLQRTQRYFCPSF